MSTATHVSTSEAALTPGEYEMTAEDSSAAFSARRGKLTWLAPAIPFAFFSVLAVLAAADGRAPSVFLPLILGMGTIVGLRLAAPSLAGRKLAKLPPERRRVKVAVDGGGVTVANAAGNVSRLVWSAYHGRRVTNDRIFLEMSNGTAHVLPRRAWTNDEFEKVKQLVERHLAAAPAPKWLGGVVVWILVLIFLVLAWSFFSDVPRHP